MVRDFLVARVVGFESRPFLLLRRGQAPFFSVVWTPSSQAAPFWDPGCTRSGDVPAAEPQGDLSRPHSTLRHVTHTFYLPVGVPTSLRSPLVSHTLLGAALQLRPPV